MVGGGPSRKPLSPSPSKERTRKPTVPGRSQPAIEKAESGLVRKAVRRAQRGDVEALHFLYLRYAPDVLCCVRKLVRDDREAEEITLDVFQGLIGLMERHEVGRAPSSHGC